MKKERLETIVMLLIGIIAGGFLFLVLLEYIFPVTAPFLIAWAVAFLVRRPARTLSKKLHIPEGIVRLFMALFVTIGVFGLLSLLVWQVTSAVWKVLADIGEGGAIYDFLAALTSPSLPLFSDSIPEALAERISDALGSMLSSALSSLAGAVTSWVSVIPKALFFLLVTLISLIYFALDLEKINAKVKSILPKKLSDKLSYIRCEFFGVALKYAKSYLLLMLITFVIMLVGFLLLRVEGAFLVAVIVAFLDLLPVIGVGTVLVPWSVLQFLSGDNTLGIGLIILFVINEVVRQFAEPKILGKNLNMHPILTLVFLYIGYALFGIIGLVIVPVFALLISFLLKEQCTAEVDEGHSAE